MDYKNACDEVDRILLHEWDPIGVSSAIPYAGGEYDAYAAKIMDMLVRGESAESIFDYLMWAAGDQMGLDDVDEAATRRIAARIRQLL